MGDPTKTLYPLTQWISDYTFMVESVANLPQHARLPASERYYDEHHVNDPASLEKKTRMVACWNYMHRHMENFEEAGIAVAGEERSLLSEHLPYVLYRLFAGIPLSKINDDFPISMIARMIDEQAQTNPDT